MDKITISVGESKRCTNWVPKNVSWEQLVKKLSTPKITDETTEEYAAMSKDQRGDVKDVGGFVGGRIDGGNRKAGSITDRQLICLDADYGDLGLWDVWDLMVGKACLMHTSHSHTPEQPRLRFVIPLSRPVTAAEYEPIARRLAQWLDIDSFDDTTYEASRLMFWPSVSKDGEFIVRTYDSQEWLDPDEMLATYDDWHDMRSWPTSSRQGNAITKMGKTQGDPLTKPGIVGAFNRAYTITEAIATYLPDTYKPAGENRWTYTEGSTVGGAVTYDSDTFIYSHHATDPTTGKLCSAFDLVRLHLYGDLDEGSQEEIGTLPSMTAMKNLCQNDEKVREQLAAGTKQTPESVFEVKVDLQRFTDDLTEQGISLVLADSYGDSLRYNKALGWLYWDGMRWVVDADAEATMLCMRFTDDMYEQARVHRSLATSKEDQERAKLELRAASSLRTAKGISHLISLLKTLVAQRETGSYDSEPWELNTPDGIIDLRTGEIRDHDRKANCTKCTAVSPSSIGVNQWDAFLDHITGGDKAFSNYLQMLAGMAAVGKVYEEGLVISYGPGGNGKSTFFGALAAVLGDYAKAINADVMVSSTYGKTDQTYIAALRGVRLAVLGETEEYAALSIAQMKKITSTDTISARSLYKDPIEFVPTHTSIMHTNHLPRLGSMDGGTIRRIAVAPFPATLPPERVITNYKDQLVQECGGAILQWIIDGSKMFYERDCKLPKPECVIKATSDYIDTEDWFGQFMADTCEVGEYEVSSSDMYLAYQRWANSQGYTHIKRANDLAKILESKGFRRRRTSKSRVWVGIRIREADL